MIEDTCRPLSAELVARSLGIVDGPELAKLQRHLGDCPDCAARQVESDLALAGAALPDAQAPAGGWERLAARLDAESKSAVKAPTRLRVTLTCSYCHDGLVPNLAHYCAACLAPHHSDCFEKHGLCSAPGCTGTATVHPQDVASSPLRPRRRWSWGGRVAVAAGVAAIAAFGAAGGASGYAAYVERQQTLDELRVVNVSVFVAAREIRAGHVFTEDDLETSEFPRGYLERSLQNTWITDRQTIVGARTQTRIRMGQVLVASQFRRLSSRREDPRPIEAMVAGVLMRYYRARRVAPDVGDARQHALEELDQIIAEGRGGWPLPWYAKADLILQAGASRSTPAQRDLLETAQIELRKAAKFETQNPVSLLAQGRLEELRGDPGNALALYGAAIERSPRLTFARLARANLRLKNLDYAGALNDVEGPAGDDYEPLMARALTIRAWARFKGSNDRVGALLDLDRALVVDPGLARALAYRAYMSLERDARSRITSGKETVDRAQADAIRALLADDGQAEAHRVLAWIYGPSQPSMALHHANRAAELERSAGAHLPQRLGR